MVWPVSASRPRLLVPLHDVTVTNVAVDCAKIIDYLFDVAAVGVEVERHK
jgi:hypothetical protein